MISYRKFAELALSSRKRKLWRWLHELEAALRQALEAGPDAPLDSSAQELAAFLADLPRELLPACLVLDWDAWTDPGAGPRSRLFLVNSLRHRLARELGQEAAEWDLFEPLGAAGPRPACLPGSLEGQGLAFGAGARLPGPPDQACRLVYCDDIRSPFNLGSIFRSANAFGLEGVVLSEACPDPLHPRCVRSAMGTIAHVPWGIASLESLMESSGLPCFALELGGRDLGEVMLPPRAIAVLGSEELGVNPALLEICRKSLGVVTIPLPGPKASLNVGVSFGILAARWASMAPASPS